MRMLEQHIMESGEASIANASLVEMQQVLFIYENMMKFIAIRCKF